LGTDPARDEFTGNGEIRNGAVNTEACRRCRHQARDLDVGADLALGQRPTAASWGGRASSVLWWGRSTARSGWSF